MPGILKYIDRGVEREIEEICQRCVEYYKLPCTVMLTGVCMDAGSDHYCHILLRDHPACKRFKEK